MPHNLLSDEGLIFFHGAEGVTAPQYQCLTDTPFQMSVGTFNRAIFVAPTGIIVYALHSVVLTESSIALSQLAASIFCLVVSMPPSGCPFYVLPALPPVVRGLPARPSARAEKLSPASTTRIQLQWLHSRRKLYNICTNNLPAIVTTTPFSLVKSNRPRRPG